MITPTNSHAAARPWRGEYGPGISDQLVYLPDANLAALARRVAREQGDSPAFVVCLENGFAAAMSFAQVDRASDRFAAYLRYELGIGAGDRIAIQAPNCLPYPVCAFGVFKAGAVLVNVNPLYTAHETQRQLADSGARALVAIDLFADKLAGAVANTAVERVVLASVTDGFPRIKGALLQAALRYAKRVIPRPNHPTTPYAKALQAGEHHRGRLLASSDPATGPADLAALQYTGGTTGLAKGAELTHGNLLANISQIHAVAEGVLRGNADTVLTALPLYHIFAFTFNFLTLYASGSRNILCPSPRPPSKLRQAFQRYRVTKFSGVNTLFQGLLREEWFRRRPPQAIDFTVAGGTALQQQVAREWQDIVGQAIHEGYGLSETSPVIAVNPPHGEVRLGTIGVPLPGTDVRIVADGAEVPPGEPGELVVRGPQVMRGYWQRDEETDNALVDGWFYTGDVARMDERGYLYIVDRKKDLIDVSGFNVYPNEVEAALSGHPDILEAAVIGMPRADGSEYVRAFVVPSGATLTEAAVLQWARQYLTGYKLPTEILFREELPKTPVGKILRRALRDEDPAGSSADSP